MADLKDVVYVNVEFFNGQDEGDDGQSYYVASCDELHFTTDGVTFEELLTNVRECLELSLRDTDSIQEYGVIPSAKVKLVMELPYAQTA